MPNFRDSKMSRNNWHECELRDRDTRALPRIFRLLWIPSPPPKKIPESKFQTPNNPLIFLITWNLETSPSPPETRAFHKLLEISWKVSRNFSKSCPKKVKSFFFVTKVAKKKKKNTFIRSSFLFIRSTISWSFLLLFVITVFDLIRFWDAMCFITELFFSDSVSLHASHLSLPDATVRCSPFHWFNVYQALTFESAVPRTFRFFSAGFVCTLCSLEIAAFAGVLSVTPASVTILKGSEWPSSPETLSQSSVNHRPLFRIFFKKPLT